MDLSLYRSEAEINKLGVKVMAMLGALGVLCHGAEAFALPDGPGYEYVIHGVHGDAKNIFRWSRVEMNLPGLEGYDPMRPWAFKC
jgi:hypothetical protein